MFTELLEFLYKNYGEDLLIKVDADFSADTKRRFDFKFRDELCIFTLVLYSRSSTRMG